jgi:Ca2+-binding EF-hand superfamily protein
MRGRFLLCQLLLWSGLLLVLDTPWVHTQPPGDKKAKAPKNGMDPGNEMNPPVFDKRVLAAWEFMAELEFKRKDSNSDGYLDVGEMPGKLREEIALWDRNRDERIDRTEFKAHFESQLRQKAWKDPQKWGDLTKLEQEIGKRMAKAVEPAESMPKPASGAMAILLDDRRPSPWRAGKLPAGLPAWFDELDKNRDGQVAMYEWRAAERPLKEFLAMDLNDDGLLTPEEFLRASAMNGNAKAQAVLSGSAPGDNAVLGKDGKAKKEKEKKDKKEKKEKKPKQ